MPADADRSPVDPVRPDAADHPDRKGPALTRRDVLAAVPAGIVLGLGGSAMAGPDGAAAAVPARRIDEVYAAPGFHWVGDGFRVAGYFNAIPDALRRLDPFVLLDYAPEHAFAPTTARRGVGPHPHRGFETVTFAFQGSVAHHDSTGAGGVIGPGDVQWMTAGAGILHAEYHEQGYGRRGGPFQMVQLWVNLPKASKFHPPRYQPLTAAGMGRASLPGGAGEVRVIAGEHLGVAGPAKTFTPITILDLSLAAGARHDVNLPEGHTVAMLVMAGQAVIHNRRAVAQDDFVLFEREGRRISIAATTACRFLVLSGRPIGEPVVQYGPFVMNTQAEIEQAYRDYRSGKMGTLDD
ncbi:MAG: pirin family protein [Planctomycetota bacterium]